MQRPIYTVHNTTPAFHLRYAWTGWPTEGTNFPHQPDQAFFLELDKAWKNDNLNRISLQWDPALIQIAFSTTPIVAPVFFVSRAKGRLQHALRQAGTPVRFSRKVAFRAIGDNHTSEVENYIAQQIDRERFIDPKFSAMLKEFSIIDQSHSLDEPIESNSGRYWYNLHVVLVVANRFRLRHQADFAKLDRGVVATAKKHQYRLAARAWMPDHFHVALRGNLAESPAQIALSIMNNTAFAMGQKAIWQHGFYAGTFSEYDVRALRGRE